MMGCVPTRDGSPLKPRSLWLPPSAGLFGAVLPAVLLVFGLPGLAEAVDHTIVLSNTGLANTCRQITVTSAFSDDDNGNSVTQVEYNTINSWPGTLECVNLAGASPRQCVIFGVGPGAAYFLRVTYDDPDGVNAPGVTPRSFVLGPVPVPSCGADDAAPTLVFLSPAAGATVGGGERFKIQVWDADGLAASNPVAWSMDGGAQSTAVSVNANYDCGTGCSVYEFDVDTTGFVNGPHFLTVTATDAAGNVAVKSQAINISNSGTVPTGDGYLLRRTHSSQLCLDCHALSTHSSQHTSDKYGSVSFECLSCHQPHLTRNIFLVRETISTPRDGNKTVTFRNTDGKADQSYATATDPGNGICEVCHTQTRNSDGTPRFRNTGESDGGKHYTTRCTACHPHSKGFAAGESEGGATCAGCHADIWDGMNGTVVKVSRHAIGNVPGVNDAFTDTATSWTDPLSANAAADRSCLNMCHQDHIHNEPGQTEHDFNVHQDARTQASRAVTRSGGAITGGTPDQTDFSGGAGGGMCMSCHQSSVDASRPALDTAAYDAGAHDFITNTVGATTYNWLYTLHDGSAFERNCTKCHTDRGDAGGGPDASAFPFGAVHFSDYPSLLAGSTNPDGTVSDFICYNCHGNDSGGTVDRSGKDIAGQVSKTYGHPTDSDAVHDSVAEENDAAFGNELGGAARHVSCLDCHDPHQARAGTHTTGTNSAGPPLEGAWGAELSTPPGFWAAPAAGNFTKKTIVAGADAEATLCFKCHSSYYGTLPTSPSGGFQQTDTAREFNPNNVGNFNGSWANNETAGGFHPVLASAANNLGATSNIISPWSRTSLMTCSDCHESNSTADPNGPHGSTASFLLKGPNTLWNSSLTSTGETSYMPTGTFCRNCHNSSTSSSRFTGHRRGDHSIPCFNCHAAIPHGGPRPGMLVARAGAESVVGGTIAGWDTSTVYFQGGNNDRLYIKRYPTNNSGNWQESYCGCNGTGH